MNCRHGQRHWRHRHYIIEGRPFCRLECKCGKVMDEGRSG